jgi:hypothetical protein
MPIQATIVLDSGIFIDEVLGGKTDFLDVGYFQSHARGPDIIIYVDGKVISPDGDKKLKLGKGTISIFQTKRNKKTKKNEIVSNLVVMDSLAENILRREELYGDPVPVNQKKLDCMLHFLSGRFRCSMVQKRKFKEVISGEAKLFKRPIAHNVQVDFELGPGDVLRLENGRKALWSSKNLKGVKRLDIEIVADNLTATKFYDRALMHPKEKCWLPNQGDPPPMGGP